MLAVVAGLAAVAVPAAFGDTIALPAAEDTFVSFGDQSTAHGSLGSFDVYGGASSYGCGTGPSVGLLRFDLSSIPANANITSAKLTLTSFAGFAYNGDPNHHAIFLSDDSWTESTLWDGKPSDGFIPGVPEGTLSGVALGTSPDHLGSASAFTAAGCGGGTSTPRVFASANLATRVAAERAGDLMLSLEILAPACGTTGSVPCSPSGSELAYFLRYYSSEASVLQAPALEVTFDPAPSDSPQAGPTFTVNTPADTDDGVCGAVDCTLSEAIDAANGHTNVDGTPDSIVFNLSADTQVALVDNGLPQITDAVVIDGSLVDRPDASINGDGAGAEADGLILGDGSDGSTIRHLLIRDFGTGAAVRIRSSGNTVESSTLRTSLDGVVVAGGSNNVIGDDKGPGELGSIDPGLANVVTENSDAGIFVTGGASGTRIVGNYVGTDSAGAATGLANGIGIQVFDAASNQIGPGNTVAHNTGAGVDVEGTDGGSEPTATGNRIVANSIHDNGGKGIALTLANRAIAAPTIAAATTAAGTTTVSGSITGTSGSTYFAEFFSNTACDTSPAGAGEGKTYLDFAPVTLDGTSAPFEKAFPALPDGTVLTATLTNASTGDTSEFSSCAPTAAASVSGTVEIAPTADTFVSAGAPTSSFGTQGYFDTYGGRSASCTPYSAPVYGLLKFDLGAIPAGAEIQSVALRTVTRAGYAQNGDGNHHLVFLPNDGWTEADATWNNRPDDGTTGWLTPAQVGSSALRAGGDVRNSPNTLGASFVWRASCGNDFAGDQVHTFPENPNFDASKDPVQSEADFVSHVSAERAGDDTLSIEVFNPNNGGTLAYWARYYSREASDPALRPRLIVTYGTTPPVVTGLTITGPATVDAGASKVPLAGIPPSALIVPQTTGAQAAPVNQSPVNQSPVNQLPVNQLATTQAPVNQLPVNQSPVNQSGVPTGYFQSLAAAPGPLGDTALSAIPLLRTGGWATVLGGTALAGKPLQSVTLRQVFALSTLPVQLQPGGANPITFAEIDFSKSPLGSLPAMTLALGRLPLAGITGIDWCQLFQGPPLNCTSGLPAGTSLLSAALAGAPVNQSPVNQSPVNQSLIDALAAAQAPVNQLPVNQLPVNQSRIGQLPVNQLPVNQSPVNQLSLSAILTANVPVNQSPVNQLPVNQLPVNQSVLQCGGSQCTGTLGDYVGRVIAGKTLGDLRAALPQDLPDTWTIADLHDFGNLIVADLLASLPQPNDLTLADILALALFANNPESFSFETLNIFDTSLSLYADPVGTAPYTIAFTLTPDGGASGGPSTVDVTVTLPRTFAYAAGTSKLAVGAGASCANGTSLADPALAEVTTGVTKATWSVSGTVGSSYKLCFSARPGIVLGPQSASAGAKPNGGVAVSATAPEPVTVVDSAESSSTNNDPPTAPTLASSSLYLSYLTSAADVDYYRFPVPAAAGTRVTFHLSHLPADYDLVIYGPQQTALRPAVASTPPLDGAPLTDTGSELTHVTDALPSQTLDDLRIQKLPLVGVSASRGTDPEDVTVLSDGGGGFYTVQITSYNGATSADPYMLRATSEAPRLPVTTPPRSVTGATGAQLGALPAGFNTVFLVNRQRLQSIYPGTGPGTGAALLTTLASAQATFQTLGFPNAVLSVDAYPAVQTAYANWDASPGSPDLANKVVAAINAVVDTQVRAKTNGAGLKYVVIVGGDRVIPQGRLGDFTDAANETGYADTFDRSSDLYATLRAGQMLSDDPYGTLEPLPYLNRQLYVPQLAVGRLVETPTEIAATLTRFGAFNGRLDPSTSLTTGYDFMQDGAAAISQPFAGRFGAGAVTLPSPLTAAANWTRSSLLTAFLPTGGSPSITSLNGHADHFEFAPPSVTPPFFTSGDLPLGPTSTPAGSTGRLVNRLVFSMGCHAGLSVSDAVVTANTYDWPQAYSHNGVGAYLGNTGFGYGDSLVVAYSEQLDSIFARKIAAGSTVGNALAATKQEYFGGLGVFGVYDEKAMAEFTLYGLPMWSVTMPGGGIAPLSVESAPAGSSGGPQLLSVLAATAVPTSTAVVTDSATGLQAESFVLDNIANTEHSTPPLGRYWSGPDGVQVTHFRPLQPKAFVDVTGTAGHAALITELRQQADTPGVDPVFARPIVDTQSSEPELAFGDVAFPSRMQALRTFRQGSTLVQRVVLMTGQFFTGTNPGSNGAGVQRLYTRIGARVLRSSSNDFVPPAFTRIDATGVGSSAAFAVDVTDLTQTGAVGQVKRVLVALRSGTATTWTFADLGQVGSSARWSGGIPLPSVGASFEYFVQAVDAAGNVGVSTNKGFYFAAAAPVAPSGNVTVAPALSAPPVVSGWFTGSTSVVVNAPTDVTLEVRVDGGPFATVAPGSGPTISGEGVHIVEARGSNGGTATTVIPIDNAAPTITIGTPAAGASYPRGSTTPADFTCADAGSGVNTCTGTVASGTPFNTATLGTKTFTVNATDKVGHTFSRSVTYNVIWPFVLFASARTGNGDIYVADTRGGAPAQLTSGNAIDAEPAWSPDHKKIAFTSTRDGNIEIYVMDADGSHVMRLTTQSAIDASPAWSPDGTKIAFSSNRTSGNWDIFAVNATGGSVARLTTNAAADTFPAWSSTGTKIAFSSARTGAGDIYSMNADGTSQTRLTTSLSIDTEPDWFGSTIAFSTNRDGLLNFEIYTMSESGGSQTRRTTEARPDTAPTWSPDGTKIAFASNRPGGANFDIYTMNADGSGQLPLAAHPSLDLFPDW